MTTKKFSKRSEHVEAIQEMVQPVKVENLIQLGENLKGMKKNVNKQKDFLVKIWLQIEPLKDENRLRQAPVTLFINLVGKDKRDKRL